MRRKHDQMQHSFNCDILNANIRSLVHSVNMAQEKDYIHDHVDQFLFLFFWFMRSPEVEKKNLEYEIRFMRLFEIVILLGWFRMFI